MTQTRTGTWWLFVAVVTVVAMVIWTTTWIVMADPPASPGPADSEPVSPNGAPAGPAATVRPALVRVDTVGAELLAPHAKVIGRLRAWRHTIVASEQAGRIINVPIFEGQPVTGATDVLAEIDDVWAMLALRSAQARGAQAQAQVTEAEARLERAKRQWAYLQRLFAANSSQKKEVDDAGSVVKIEEARLLHARAALAGASAESQRATVQQQRVKVLAPFDGYVVQKLVETGQWVQPGTGIAEVISRGRIEAIIDVAEHLINQIRLDAPVAVQIDALQVKLEGRVRSVVPQGDNAARTFPLIVALDDRGGQLKPGMSVTVTVPTGAKQMVLTVPREALVRSASKAAVWVVSDAKALRVDVEVLFAAGPRLAITAGQSGPTLTPGMQVIVEGGERLLVSGHPVALAP